MTLSVLQRLSLLLVAAAMPVIMAGCASSKSPAQVVERAQPAKKSPPPRVVRPREPDWRPSTHVVERGDTLHAIALAYGYDYREIAELNGIGPPYLIRIGQELKLPGGTGAAQPGVAGATAQPAPGVAVTAPLRQPGAIEGKPLTAADSRPVTKTQPKALKLPYSPEALTQIAELERDQDQPERAPAKVAEAPAVVRIEPKSEPVKPETAKAETPKPKGVSEDNKPLTSGDARADVATEADEETLEWVWPASGKIVAGFSEGGAKGVDIGGRSGQPVIAAAPGKVVYSGNNLRGYGNLVIIKHNKTYLSAYAHNSLVVVKEGQSVSRGQKIAEMGKTDADSVKLHFEIRRFGKPVDPLKYLPEKQ